MPLTDELWRHPAFGWVDTAQRHGADRRAARVNVERLAIVSRQST